MIQRIQSVFLFLVMLCMTLMLFFPLWSKTNTEEAQQATLTALSVIYTQKGEIVTQKSTAYLSALAALSIVLAATSLFSFKNRMTQVKINLFNTLLLAGTLITCVLLSFNGERFFAVPAQGSYGLGFFMPAAALVFNALATRFIRRDEMLVRSMDRLR
jgi:predicted membrane channel-forming protein YqfA (hemolysin III family)